MQPLLFQIVKIRYVDWSLAFHYSAFIAYHIYHACYEFYSRGFWWQASYTITTLPRGSNKFSTNFKIVGLFELCSTSSALRDNPLNRLITCTSKRSPWPHTWVPITWHELQVLSGTAIEMLLKLLGLPMLWIYSSTLNMVKWFCGFTVQ